MTDKEALKIASWLVDDELCEEESEYCNKSCIECQREVQKILLKMAQEKNDSVWLKIGKNTFMCPVCKAQITGNENIKYQRYCYWCGTKMTQDEEAEDE